MQKITKCQKGGLPAFRCLLHVFVPLSFLFSVSDGKNMKKLVLTQKNDFDQQMSCVAPFRWSKYTTEVNFVWQKNISYENTNRKDLVVTSNENH